MSRAPPPWSPSGPVCLSPSASTVRTRTTARPSFPLVQGWPSIRPRCGRRRRRPGELCRDRGSPPGCQGRVESTGSLWKRAGTARCRRWTTWSDQGAGSGRPSRRPWPHRRPRRRPAPFSSGAWRPRTARHVRYAFSLEDLRDRLGGAECRDDQEYADHGLQPDQIDALRTWAVEWATDIKARLRAGADSDDLWSRSSGAWQDSAPESIARARVIDSTTSDRMASPRAG